MDNYYTHRNLPTQHTGHNPSIMPFVTVSDAFYPGAYHSGSDLTLITIDQVLFYLHVDVLCQHSPDGFHELLLHADISPMGERIVQIAETSEVLDAMAHFLYGLAYVGQAPSRRIIVDAVLAMPKYGIDVRAYLVPSNPCYGIILAFTPMFPLEVYALAAQFDIVSLASSASSYLLSVSIPDLSDEMVYRIGPVYIKKLLGLHMDRSAALKRIISSNPYPHPPTKDCRFNDQKRVGRAWALVAAHIAWDARPDFSAGTIMSTFGSLSDRVECDLCKASLETRLKDIISQWVVVKRTI